MYVDAYVDAKIYLNEINNTQKMCTIYVLKTFLNLLRISL